MFDGHCHLDKSKGTCREAMLFLHGQAKMARMKGIILLNIPAIAYPNDEVLDASGEYDGFFKVFPGVSPKCPLKAIKELKKKGASGIKMHPRIDGKVLDGSAYVKLIKAAAELNMPILVDCFPDGINLSLGNMPQRFAALAQEAPDARIAIGHAGGHNILDALMIAKCHENIFLDLSYTLLYYRNSNVMQNIAFAINSIKGRKVFWGSDYPDRPYLQTVRLSLEEILKMRLPAEYRKAVLEDNAIEFLRGK